MATTPTPPGHATKQAASTLTKVVASLKKIYGDQAVACGGSPDDPPDFVVNPNETIEMTCFVALENGALSAAEDSAIATVMVEASEDGSDVWPLIVGSRSAAALFAGQGYALYANEGQDAALSASIAKRLGLVEH
ncbi:MAG: hypothetical protein IPJ14_14835 [Kineosporiaceae bacterium]|nr:hypothetical protein [Kineosporiaceae bacterium]MBK7623893.1 hypothetical protein [Kineosporiaceae bacterium]